MNKKIKKALMAGAAMYGASKLMGAKEKSLLASTEDGKSASSMITGGKDLNDYNMKNSIKKKGILSKILNLGPGKNATSSKGGTLAGDYGDAFGDGYSGGAKYGKMIKAKDGVYVTAKCKNGRNKATKIT
jgi:hypothetical protein